MSLIICVYNSDSVTVCSEDRAGVYDATGEFVPTDDGVLKSELATPGIIVAATGRISLARAVRTFIASLAQAFSFDRLANLLPTIAQALVQAAGDNPELSIMLAGWDNEKNKIRAVAWHGGCPPDCFSEMDASAEPNYILIGATNDVHEVARPLIQSGDVPNRFREIYDALANVSPMIGRGLTVHTVTPECGKPLARRNQLTGSGRAYTNINADNTYSTVAYHGSAFRRNIANPVTSSTSDAAGVFETVGSFVLQVPSGYSQYKGTLSLSHAGSVPFASHGRLKIGSLTSNVIDLASLTAGPQGGTGAGAGWSGPTNIAATDGVYATQGIAGTSDSTNLSTSAMGFSIPATATINGIQVDIVRHASAASSLNFADPNGLGNFGVALTKVAGTQTGTAKTNSTLWGTSDATTTLGGSTDLWGTTWTPSDINSAGFGVVCAVANANASGRTASIDSIRVTVTYTDSASGTVTVTGITGGAQVTVEVQIKQDAGSVGTETATFNRVEYADQDITNLA